MSDHVTLAKENPMAESQIQGLVKEVYSDTRENHVFSASQQPYLFTTPFNVWWLLITKLILTMMTAMNQ